ncbi:ankyrin repeat domain-containing protein [Candidatus Dependentiae bacterium]
MFKSNKTTILSIAVLCSLASSLSLEGGNIFEAIRKKNLKEVKRLVKKEKVDINKANRGWTPLYCACSCNSLDIVKYLVQNGAKKSINEANDDVETPLYWACMFNNLDMAKLLVENGAQIDVMSRLEAQNRNKIKTYILNVKKFDDQKNMLGKTKFVIDKVKKIKLDNNNEKQGVIDLIRLVFCRSIFETIEKQELYKNTTFYTLYQLCKSKPGKKIRSVILQAFGINENDLKKKYPDLIKIMLRKVDLGAAKSKKFFCKCICSRKMLKSNNRKKFVDCIIKTYL